MVGPAPTLLRPLGLLLFLGVLPGGWMGTGVGVGAGRGDAAPPAAGPRFDAPHPSQLSVGEILVLDLRPHGDHVHAGSMIRVPGEGQMGSHPSFLDHHTVLFSTPPGSAAHGSGGVGLFDLVEDRVTWWVATPVPEVDPRPVPGSEAVTAIRLLPPGPGDAPGGSPQGGVLVRHRILGEGSSPEAERVLPGVEDVARHAWAGPNRIALLREGGGGPTLHMADLESGEIRKVADGVGGILESIPGTGDVAFEDRSDPERPLLMRLEGASGTVTPVAELPPEGGVVAWLPGPTALLVWDGTLYRSTGDPTRPWHPILAVGPVTGLAASPGGLRIALVVPGGE